MTTKKNALLTAGATALLVLAAPLAASAHVGLEPGEAPTGGSTVLTFAFGHGCDGSPTTGLRFTIPEEVAGLKPTAKAGWSIDISETEILYTAAEPVPDAVRDTVQLQVSLDDSAPEGTVIAFPVTQLCEDGETAWDMVAADGEDAHDLERPAPTLVVTAAEADGHDGHGSAEGAPEDAAETATAGDPVPLILGGGALVISVLALVVALVGAARRRPAAE